MGSPVSGRKDWGTADPNNVFFLPDLRGLFLRSWNHDRQAPAGPTGAPDVFKKRPYQGDLAIDTRVVPRPEALTGSTGSVNPNTGEFDPNHVGSLQPNLVGPHRHWVADNVAIGGSPNGGFEYTNNPGYRPGGQFYTYSHYTDTDSNSASVQIPRSDHTWGVETHSDNAYVMYFIYVGKAASDIEAANDSVKKGNPGSIWLCPQVRKKEPPYGSTRPKTSRHYEQDF